MEMKNIKLKSFLKKLFCKEDVLIEENRKLKKEIKKLKLQNSFKDDLISAISHEFKNPISIINGYIETILNSSLPKELENKFLNKIHNNTIRLTQLIDRLYLITKIENKKMKIKKESFRLDLAIKEVIENFDEKRIIFHSIPLKVKADKNLLQIVIYNLISNALKYSQDEVIINLNENYLEVIDKGIGIEEKNLNNIKNKFFRVAKNEWDNSLGLGLYIVERILKLHHTTLKIKSQYKKGSKFYFDITSIKDKEPLTQ